MFDLILPRMIQFGEDSSEMLLLISQALMLRLFGFPRVRLCRREESSEKIEDLYCAHDFLFLLSNCNPRVIKYALNE